MIQKCIDIGFFEIIAKGSSQIIKSCIAVSDYWIIYSC